MAMGEDFKTPGSCTFLLADHLMFFFPPLSIFGVPNFMPLFWFLYGYESIPIDTIFRGMNIHKSQLFWCSPGVQGFDPLLYISTVFLLIQMKHWLGKNNSSAPAKLLRLCCRSSSSTEFWDPSGAVPVHDQKWAAQHCSVRKHQGVFLVNDSLI